MNWKPIVGMIALPLLFSCATITVNVYFPDKDVEAVYEDIESGLDFEVDTKTKKDTAALKAKPKSKARSSLWLGATPAWAEEQVKINAELKKMKDVQESIARRRDRIETLGRLFEAWRVGLDERGLVARVQAASRPDSAAESVEDIFGVEGGETDFVKFLESENKDRQILIRGMAVATLRATEQDEKDKESLNNALQKSREIFTKTQTGKLRDGWFYQDSDGSWKQLWPPAEEE